MTNNERFFNRQSDQWASTHVLDKLVFWWLDGNNEAECTLHNRTYSEALAIAVSFGYVEPKWYKPWTWNNGVITVG